MYPNLKLQLWKTGLRQNRLAQRLNIDETVLSRIVNGFRQPSDTLKLRIAEALQSDIDWLFEAEDESPAREERVRVEQAGK
jgi:transcriptional regulator with XRE-family HTH domain